MIKRYGIDAVIMIAAFIVCLLGLEVFHTWQRVNILWAVALQQEQARTAQQPAAPPATK
jgi:hypothetical protein